MHGRTGVLVRGSLRSVLAVPVTVVSAALVLGLMSALPVQAAPAPSTVPTPAAVQEPVVTQRQDAVLAQMAARAQGSRVEVAGERSEARRVWANPDGSFTAEVYAGPNWTRDATGDWVEIDTTLIRDATGRVVPRAAGVQVVLAGAATPAPASGVAGVAEVAVARSALDGYADARLDPEAPAPVSQTAGPDPVSVTVGFAGALPEPTLSANEATYPEVAPGRDLRIRVLPSGVQTFVDLKSRPTALPAAGLEVVVPLSAKGLTVAESADGGLLLKNAKTGEVVGAAPAARVWDASVDPVSGDSAHGIVADTQVRKTGSGYQLVVTVPATYFDTPGLTYPVTVDPAATLGAAKDTYVEKGYDTTAFGSEPDLKVGTYDAGTHVGRSYVQFTLTSAASFVDATTVVDSAKLKLWLYHSASCTSASMYCGS